jgi:hypothetical protein
MVPHSSSLYFCLLDSKLLSRIIPAKDAFIVTSSLEKLGSIHIEGTKPADKDGFRIGLTNPANLEETLYGIEACEQIGAWHVSLTSGFYCYIFQSSNLPLTPCMLSNQRSMGFWKLLLLSLQKPQW